MGELEGVLKVVLLIGGVPSLIILASGISSAIQFMVSGRTPVDGDDLSELKDRLTATERRLEAAEEQARFATEQAEQAQARLRQIEAGDSDEFDVPFDTPTSNEVTPVS